MLTKANELDTAIRPQTGLQQLVARHPLVTFFVLCYAVSWTLWIPIAVLRDAIPGAVSTLALVVGSNVPSAVAIFLAAISRGKHGTRQLLGKLLIWRIRPRWYLMLLAPTALILVSITVVAVLFGGPTATLGVPLVAAVIMVALMTLPGSAFGEEVGWRGYALPRLQSVRTALIASLVLGTLHGLWHLPLWLMGDPDNQLNLYPAFVIQVIAVAVIYTWLYNGTKGSLLLAGLFHAALNVPLTLVLLPLGHENVTLPFWLLSGLWVVAAIIVVAVFGPSQLSRQQRLQEPPQTSPMRSHNAGQSGASRMEQPADPVASRVGVVRPGDHGTSSRAGGQRPGKPIGLGDHQRVTGSAGGEGQPKAGSVAASSS